MFRCKQKLALVLGILLLLAVPLGACKEKPPPMPKIDLQQVGEAFERATGTTATAWMWDFEWRVNQIYAGKKFVRISARRVGGKLRIIGYVDLNKRPGYQLSDDLIFQLRQFRGAWSFGYKVYDHIGWAGYTKKYKSAPTYGFYGVLIARPYVGFYYTRSSRLTRYRTLRRKYRSSAKYKKRRARAKKFRSRAKKAGKSRSKARRSSRSRSGKR